MTVGQALSTQTHHHNLLHPHAVLIGNCWIWPSEVSFTCIPGVAGLDLFYQMVHGSLWHQFFSSFCKTLPSVINVCTRHWSLSVCCFLESGHWVLTAASPALMTSPRRRWRLGARCYWNIVRLGGLWDLVQLDSVGWKSRGFFGIYASGIFLSYFFSFSVGQRNRDLGLYKFFRRLWVKETILIRIFCVGNVPRKPGVTVIHLPKDSGLFLDILTFEMSINK